MMWYVERKPDGEQWHTMMVSTTRIGVTDLHGPPGPHSNYHTFGGDLYASLPTPGNQTSFAGRPGWQVRVRHNDTMVELFDWDRILDNPADPDSDYKWGWKLVAENYGCVPFEDLWPQQFG